MKTVNDKEMHGQVDAVTWTCGADGQTDGHGETHMQLTTDGTSEYEDSRS